MGFFWSSGMLEHRLLALSAASKKCSLTKKPSSSSRTLLVTLAVQSSSSRFHSSLFFSASFAALLSAATFAAKYPPPNSAPMISHILIPHRLYSEVTPACLLETRQIIIEVCQWKPCKATRHIPKLIDIISIVSSRLMFRQCSRLKN